jgi:hypothetical protein
MTTIDYQVGQRVQIHPATDAWMQGDRYGEVIKVGRKYVHVRMDRSRRTLAFLPKYVLEVVS